MSTALEGVRIIDLTREMVGSLGTALLGDLGAEVLRVEGMNNDTGHNQDLAEVRYSAKWNYWFDFIHRNKKNIGVNLKSEGGTEIIAKLTEKSHVFATDMREQILREMGLDYESLSKINPRLIYARCSGFGPNGPLKDMPVIDELAAARSGLMPTLPQPGQPPVYTGAGKPLTAIALAYGIILALYHCERTGEGQKVDVSCFGTNIIFQSCVFQGYLATYARGKPSEMRAICSLLEPLAREDCGNPLINMYRTKDGRWVYLAMPQTDLYWSDFCKAMGIEEFEHDVRFDNHEKRCGEGRKELGYILDKIFATRTIAEWIEGFKGTNLIYDVVRTYAEVSNDVQALENSYIVELNHPSYGWVKTVGFPVELVGTPARICNLSSSVGQSTQAVLVDLLGYDLDRIMQMKKRGEIF